MAARSVCIFGGSGFVGRCLAATLARNSWRITVPTRDPARARHLSPIPSLRLIAADVHDPAQLAALCTGQSTVINLIGILNERGRDGSGFARVHVEFARKLVEACRQERVQRLLQVSALNADAERGTSHYLRSKGRAEQIGRAHV